MTEATRRATPRWRTALSCVGAGVLLAASLPPWGFWPLAFAGIAWLDHLLGVPRRGARALRTAGVAFTLLAITFFWMKDLTVPGYVIAVVVFAALFGVFALALPAGRARHVALPAVWALAEMAKARWPFGGVPISDLAIGQAGGPLLGVARVGGVPLLSGVTVACGVVFALALARRWRGALVGVAVVAVILTGAHLAPRGTDTGQTARVALVQGGGEQGTRAINSDFEQVFDVHMDAARTVEPPVDLVLWPEDVVDLDAGDIADADEAKGERLSELARDLDATVIAGVVQNAGPEHFRNFSVVIDPDGRFGERYDKVHRVPFGEYVPLRWLVEPFAGPSLPARDALAGTHPAVLPTDHGPVGVVISWEVFFGDRARAAIRSGGEILYNPTNGSSYTLTLVQTQQIAASRLRAVETGRWTLQVAPTGFTAVIDPSGTVLQRSRISEPRVLRAIVARRTGETLYVRYGDLPPFALAVGALGVGWAVSFADRRTGRHST